MDKIDLKKDLKQLYSASADTIGIIEVPPLKYLMAEGQGDPNTAPAFQQAAETLFRLSYTLKFMMKKEQGLDWTVMPLEGLWCADDLAAYAEDRRDEWKWTLMILQPDFITRENLDRAAELVRSKKGAPPLYDTTFGRHTDGQSAQILHVGPYAGEPATIARLHRFIREKGYHFAGKHHEIYLGDPRRTAPEKLKTILRQPISLEVQK
ncbi:MAG: GyrI-like domain-containing protein [Desulfobaccales bacterium]